MNVACRMSSSLIVGGAYHQKSTKGLFTSSRRSFLPVSRSRFSLVHNKFGRRVFPPFRHPHRGIAQYAFFCAPRYWSQHVSKNPCVFLSQKNYITAAWTQKFWLDHKQTYTMQHATSGVTLQLRRYPIQHKFTWANRFMVGKPLCTWSKGRPDLIDEAALTKGQRAALVKKGLLST